MKISVPPVALATFQVLTGHIWMVTTVRATAGRDHAGLCLPMPDADLPSEPLCLRSGKQRPGSSELLLRPVVPQLASLSDQALSHSLCLSCPQHCTNTGSQIPAVLRLAHPTWLQAPAPRPCLIGRAVQVMLSSLLRKPKQNKNQGWQPWGASKRSHFLLVLGKRALTISCPQGGTKAVLKHQHGPLLLSLPAESFLAFPPKGPPSPSPVPAVCLLCPLVPFLPLVSGAGELGQGCGSVLMPHSFKAPTPSQTSPMDHMFFLLSFWLGSTSNSGILFQPLTVPPQNPHPSERFHREGKRWLSMKKPGPRRLRHYKLISQN